MATIANFLRIHAQRHPAREALIFGDVRINFADLDRRVDGLVSSLLSMGLRGGDRVAVLATNSHRYVELQYVLARAGLVLVPINCFLSPTDILYVVNDARPRAFFFDPAHKETWEFVCNEADCIEISVAFEGSVPGALCFDDLLSSKPEKPSSSECDLRAILYTSGTTGTPKGCLCSHTQLVSSLSNFIIEIPIPRDRPSLLVPPAFTGVGAYMCGAVIYLGAPHVIVPRFDPALVLDIVEKERIAHFFGVPTMLLAIAREQCRIERDLSSLQLVGYGGATISPGQIDEIKSTLGCDLYQFFGATETGGAITFLTPEDHQANDDRGRKKLWSCGRPSLFAEIKIIDENGKELGTDQDGEFVVRSPANIIEYINKPADTAELFTNGWLHTGEIVRQDADGYLYIVDRKKDIIRTGGMNVAPSEVEARLHEHPAVLMAAVIGVPDAHYTEAVKAVVKLRDGEGVTEIELIAFVRERLAGYKTPKTVDFVDALPLNPTGKVLKRVLREKYWREERRIEPTQPQYSVGQ